MHLCRGNRGGQWHSEGSYDDVAERLFNALNIQFYFLEYDSPRAGTFTPLRLVPRHKTVVLGIVSTKTPVMENKDAAEAADRGRGAASSISTASPSARSAASPASTPAIRSRRRYRSRSSAWWSSWHATSGASALRTMAMRRRLLGLALLRSLCSRPRRWRRTTPGPPRPVRLIARIGPRRQSRRAGAPACGQVQRSTFGKPFIVENMPGAGGIVAANMVAKSPPDGHVLMFGDSGTMAINPALNPNLGYDPIKDFAPVTALVSLPTIMSANPNVPADDARRVHRARQEAAGQDELSARPAQARSTISPWRFSPSGPVSISCTCPIAADRRW